MSDLPIAEGTIPMTDAERLTQLKGQYGAATLAASKYKDAVMKEQEILSTQPKFLGTKTDKYKPRWSLLPVGTVNEVIKVLEFGAEKYQVNNWQHVPDARTRYYDATMRHLESWFRGEKDDAESGLPHLAHAAACLLFLLWFDKEKK